MAKENEILKSESKEFIYFKELKKQIQKINLDDAVDKWQEEFYVNVVANLWEYVEKNNNSKNWNGSDNWTCDKKLYKRVVKDLKQAMDLMNMCHLSNSGNDKLVDKNIIKIIQYISQNEVFTLYEGSLMKKKLKEQQIAKIIRNLFDCSDRLNYIEELDDLYKKM